MRKNVFCICCLILVCLFAGYGAADVRSSEGLSVRKERVDGETAWSIVNSFYEVSILPEKGAVLKGFRLRPEGQETTYFREGDFSGLLQEVHTAEKPYDLVEKEIVENQAIFVFAASKGSYEVERKMIFRAESPSIRVKFSFENHSDFPRKGDRAPALSNAFGIGGKGGSGISSYHVGGLYGSDSYAERGILRRLHPLLEDRNEPVPWLGVVDPVLQAGVGMVFLDAGVDNLYGGRNAGGVSGLEIRFQALPAGSRLVTEMLLLPVKGFASVDLLSSRAIAETSHVKSAGEEKLSLGLKFLMEGEHDLTIVTRAYDDRGKELGPLETVVLEGMDHSERRGEIIDVGADLEEMSWVVHELYVEGRRIKRYAVRINEAHSPPDVSLPALPESEVELLENDGEAPLTKEKGDVEREISVSRISGLKWETVEELELHMPTDAQHTLLLKIEPEVEIRDLQVDIVGTGADHREGGSRALSAANALIWEVENADSPKATLRPFRRRETMERGDTLFVAITFSSEDLEEGTYGARLLVSSASRMVEIPLTKGVFPVRLDYEEDFALWHIHRPADQEPASFPKPGHFLSAVSFGITGETDRYMAQSLTGAYEEENFKMMGFYSPGMAVVYAERVKQWKEDIDGKLAAVPLTWLVCMNSDGTSEVKAVKEFGFIPAVFLHRFSPSMTEKMQNLGFRHVILGGDVPVDGSERFGAEGEKGEEAPDTWRYVDLRPYHWREVGVRVRREFFNALLSGATGAAMRTAAPLESSGELLHWHLIRDVREEAALLSRALGAAEDPSVPDSMRNRLSALIGGNGTAPLVVKEKRGAFGDTVQLHISREVSYQEAIQQLRRVTLEILAAAEE